MQVRQDLETFFALLRSVHLFSGLRHARGRDGTTGPRGRDLLCEPTGTGRAAARRRSHPRRMTGGESSRSGPSCPLAAPSLATGWMPALRPASASAGGNPSRVIPPVVDQWQAFPTTTPRQSPITSGSVAPDAVAADIRRSNEAGPSVAGGMAPGSRRLDHRLPRPARMDRQRRAGWIDPHQGRPDASGTTVGLTPPGGSGSRNGSLRPSASGCASASASGRTPRKRRRRGCRTGSRPARRAPSHGTSRRSGNA